MTAIQRHSPLEVFLLFQTIQAIGSEPALFARISDKLKENEFVKESSNYEPGRLNPGPLRALYVELLTAEVRKEKSRSSSPTTTGGGHNPRKRKLSTPPFGSVEEEAGHKNLLPRLVQRLFAKYRDYVFKAVEDEEKKIRSLQKDIQEIERGEWDARLQVQDNTSRRESKGVSSIQTLLRDDVEDSIRDGYNAKDRHDGLQVQSTVLNGQDFTPHPDVSGHMQHMSSAGEASSRLPDGTSRLERPSSVSGAHQGYSPNADNYQNLSRPSSQSKVDSHGNYLPSLNNNARSPSLDVNRRLPPPAPHMAAPSLTSPRLSNSPIILPPPPGMLRSSGSPVGHLDALADMAGQQYRSNPNIQSPRQGQFYSPQQPHPNQLPQPRNYMQRSYPYYDSQVPYAQHYPPYNQSPLQAYQSPSQGQFQSSGNPAQPYWSGSRQTGAPQYQSPLPPYPQYPGYNSGYQPSSQASHPVHEQSPRVSTQATPLPSDGGMRRPQRPSPIDTSVSSTKWKRVPFPGSVAVPGSPCPPGPESISPISDRAASPPAQISEAEDRSTRSRYRMKALGLESNVEAESTPSRGKVSTKGARGGRPRGSTSRARGARTASTASSMVAGSVVTRTRSQSLASHADDTSFDNIRGSSRKIKHEPPATPATVVEDVVSTPGGETLRTFGRIRHHTVRSLERPLSNRPGNKRKRESTVEGTPDLPSPTSNVKPSQVLASRNFPRTSAPIMNDITTHKLASMFAKPLTEREAPGYKDVIYRPQDLKSIKTAINAGSRAVAALEEAGSPATGSTKGSATLWVDEKSDMMPPKGIVNSSQLEKELCRIFANAIMFNPDSKRGLGPAFRTRSKAIAAGGDDLGDEDNFVVEEDDGGGVVGDAREMFEAVEKSVGNWRAAERTGEDGRTRLRGGDMHEDESLDEHVPEEVSIEEESSGPSKRRRRG